MKKIILFILLFLITNSVFADKKITQLPELTVPASDDLLIIVDDVAGVPTTKKITLDNLLNQSLIDHINVLSTGTLTHAEIDALFNDIATDTTTLEGYIFDLWDSTTTLETAIADGTWLLPPVDARYYPIGGLPGAPSVGDRYLSIGTANGWTDGYIYEWDGSVWVETIPEEGQMVWIIFELLFYVYFSGGWVEVGEGSYVPYTGATETVDLGSEHLTTTGIINSGDIIILSPTPILILKDSNSLGAASVGYIEWRDSGGGRAGFLGNNTSGDDGFLWKNEQGGNIGIQTTGAGELQLFTNVNLESNNLTNVGDITAAGDIDIKPSGDIDDYLKFLTTTNQPIIKSIGGAGYELNQIMLP